jgi:hypothetical protein
LVGALAGRGRVGGTSPESRALALTGV